MKSLKRWPRKVWLLLACAVVMAMSPVIGWWSGPKTERDVFLEAVATDLAKDSRLSVVRVDREAGQLTVNVKPVNRTLTLNVTKVESKTLPSGQVGQEWGYEWKDPAGKVIVAGRGMGQTDKSFHIQVPGLP